MDYQQSIKNLNHLKNFVRAWSECRIFFFFKSEIEYEIKIYDSTFTSEQQENIDECLQAGFPYGYICNKKNGEEELYYYDENIHVEYDLFLNTFDDFICHDIVDTKIIQKQFEQLIEILKNKIFS
jgi:hypothetical protein